MPGLPITTTTLHRRYRQLPWQRGANIWHQCLEHPNDHTMEAAWDIAETGVTFTDSLTTCDICKISKYTEQPFRNKPGKTEMMKWLQFVRTDLLRPVTPAARLNYRFMSKYTDHCTKFKAVYFISTKNNALATLVKIVQGFVIPLGRYLLQLRADGSGEFIADYYRDYCKTTVVIQQFNSPNTTEKNGVGERDGQTIKDVAW